MRQSQPSWPDLKAIRTEKARRRLAEYTRQAWHLVEPGAYVHGWHIDAISEHLEAVTRGEIRNLLINIPPRHMKSLSVAVFWPTWAWASNPALRWLFASYADKLAIRDSVKCRDIIRSPWYQERWGKVYQLKGDQNVKGWFLNTKGGHRVSTSVGGTATGEGGDILVVDDPHNAKQAESDVQREEALIWWDRTMSTRLNDQKTGRKVIVMQRLHQKDLSGHVLEQGGYVHLVLPAEYEPKLLVDFAKQYPKTLPNPLGFTDPRTEEGELLFPERVGKEELDRLKVQLGTYGSAGQLQQRPVPAEGGMLKLGWFLRYRLAPSHPIQIVQSWDTANKAKKDNDYWVCTTWAVTQNGYAVLDVYRHRHEYPDGYQAVVSQAAKWKPHAVLVEDKSSGQALIQDLRAKTRIPVIAIEPCGDKVTRASVTSPLIESGKVSLPQEAEWLADFETEVQNFPLVEHDDQVDSMSQFLGWVDVKDEPNIR